MKAVFRTLATCVFVAVLAAFGLPPAAAQQRASSRWALLIAVNDCGWAKRDYCGADMQALSEVLVKSGFPEAQVYLLHDKTRESKLRPSRANIEEQLALILKRAGRGDLVIVGFGGHELRLEGKRYLCPQDAKRDDPQSLIAVDTLSERLQQSPAAIKLLLVDAACSERRTEGEPSRGPTAPARPLASALEQPPTSIVVLSSCGPSEFSHEDKELGHGVFMHFLLEGLRGQADINANRRVSLMEVYLFVSAKTRAYVARKFNDSQRPSLKGDISDDFELTSGS